MNWFTDSEIDIKEDFRTARIASARNQLTKKSRRYLVIHYVVMADMDEGQECRAGDTAFLCADAGLIKSAIGFSAKYSLEASTRSLF